MFQIGDKGLEKGTSMWFINRLIHALVCGLLSANTRTSMWFINGLHALDCGFHQLY